MPGRLCSNVHDQPRPKAAVVSLHTPLQIYGRAGKGSWKGQLCRSFRGIRKRFARKLR
jgi:hypothetical protein